MVPVPVRDKFRGHPFKCRAVLILYVGLVMMFHDWGMLTWYRTQYLLPGLPSRSSRRSHRQFGSKKCASNDNCASLFVKVFNKSTAIMAAGSGWFSSTRRAGSSLNKTLLGCMFLATLILLFQMARDIPSSLLFTDFIVHDESSLPTRLMDSASSATGWDAANPLGIPKGKAQNLPSIRVEDNNVDSKRKIYGGAGDKKHLGGFTEVDLDGISPDVWKHMVTKYGVKSVLDVGCGRGVSSLWFHLHGVDVLCVEGSHDAVERTMLPDPTNQVVEHDFSRGPWWPENTYSACWAVEFLEHVSYVHLFSDTDIRLFVEIKSHFEYSSFSLSGYNISSTS